MECFYDNQSTAEEKRDTKVEEFYFIFFGVGGERWLAGRWWALIFLPLPLWSSFRSDSKSNFWS